MSIRWLTVQSLQNSQELLAAINTLSIHTKLLLAGKPDEDRAAAADEAKKKLNDFLEQLEQVAGDEQEADQPVLGADPRLRQLARSFIKARSNHRRFRSELVKERLSDVRQLLFSEETDDRRSLVRCLADLRIIIEEHLQADADKMLGRF